MKVSTCLLYFPYNFTFLLLDQGKFEKVFKENIGSGNSGGTLYLHPMDASSAEIDVDPFADVDIDLKEDLISQLEQDVNEKLSLLVPQSSDEEITHSCEELVCCCFLNSFCCTC